MSARPAPTSVRRKYAAQCGKIAPAIAIPRLGRHRRRFLLESPGAAAWRGTGAPARARSPRSGAPRGAAISADCSKLLRRSDFHDAARCRRRPHLGLRGQARAPMPPLRARRARRRAALSLGVLRRGSVEFWCCGACIARAAAVQPNRRNRGPFSNERPLVVRHARSRPRRRPRSRACAPPRARRSDSRRRRRARSAHHAPRRSSRAPAPSRRRRPARRGARARPRPRRADARVRCRMGARHPARRSDSRRLRLRNRLCFGRDAPDFTGNSCKI